MDAMVHENPQQQKQQQQQQLYHRQLNRQRVLDFEREMQSKLGGLDALQRDLNSMGQLRRVWLQHLTKHDDVGTDNFLKKLQAMKLKAELSSLQMTLDICRLEGHSEAHALDYLVACTQPLEDGETEEQRNVQLQQLVRAQSDVMVGHLQESLDTRSSLARINFELQQQLSQQQQSVQLQQQQNAEEFEEKIAVYAQKMRVAVQRSRIGFERITAEYLILRHNARVAKQVLVRGQNDATSARRQLQHCLAKIVEEAQLQRDKAESASSAELTLLTSDLRRQVMQKEQRLDALTARVREMRRRQRQQNVSQMSALREFESRYQQLQQQRRGELQRVTAELSRLRQMVAALQLQLATAGVAAPGCSAGVAAAAHRIAAAAATEDSGDKSGKENAQNDLQLMQQLRSMLQKLQQQH